MSDTTRDTRPQTPAPRAYHSPRRREQAGRTERRIVDAATELFVGQGWSATSLAQVAQRAEVSPAMLHKVFRTKADLAKRVYDVAVVGDQEPIPFRERPEFLAVVAVPDPRAKLRGYTHLLRGLVERVLPIYAQIRAAVTAGESALVDFADTIDNERLYGATGIVADLERVAELRPGLSTEQAVDLTWMAMSPEFWALLVARRGWSWEDAEAYAGDHLIALLLADSSPASPE